MTRLEYTSDTSANWKSTNPILEDGELVVENDTKRFKKGDGITSYLDLEYLELYPTSLRASFLLTQTGTADPVVRVLENTIGSMVWTRTAVGTYTVTSDGAFREGKAIPIEDSYVDIDGNLYTLERTDENTMTLKTYAAVNTEVLADAVLVDRFIHIEIFK